MTVYIVQEPVPNNMGWTPDFSTAAEYGQIKYIFHNHEKPYALHGPALHKARKFFREEFNPKEDYILWPNTGDPMAYAIVNTVIGEMKYESVNHLYWNRKRDIDGTRDKKQGFYFPINLKLNEEKKEGDDEHYYIGRN